MHIKPFSKQFRFTLLIIIVLIVLTSCVNNSADRDQQKDIDEKNMKENKKGFGDSFNNFGWPSPTARYITAVPVDLTQIQAISKYRSCAGHIRDGYDFDRVLENDSSMKHYLFPIPEFQGTIDKVKMFAPFDGTVYEIFWEKDKFIPERPHNGNGITFTTPIDPDVKFIFGHLYFAQEFKVGDKVKAGQLIGYASLGNKGNDFDIDLTALGRNNEDKEVLGSAFDHMTDSVLTEFAKNGITTENTKFTREYRDAHPCGYYEHGLSYSEVCNDFSTKKDEAKEDYGRNNDCWVQLIHSGSANSENNLTNNNQNIPSSQLNKDINLLNPTQENAEKALVIGTQIIDKTGDWVSTGEHGDNPSFYTLDFVDIKEIDIGIDEDSLYVKSIFNGAWPKGDSNWPSINGDQITDLSFTVMIDTDNNPRTGCLSDGGTEIDLELGTRINFPYGKPPGTWNGYKTEPSGIENPEEKRYLNDYIVNDEMIGGPGYDYVLNVYPLKDLKLTVGQIVSLKIKAEAMSKKYHHASFDDMNFLNGPTESKLVIKLGENKTIN